MDVEMMTSIPVLFSSIIFIYRQLLAERKCLKENSPLTDRLMAKAMAISVK
jgi:hypothetical protein